jgi:hypothetical protein
VRIGTDEHANGDDYGDADEHADDAGGDGDTHAGRRLLARRRNGLRRGLLAHPPPHYVQVARTSG